MDLYKKFDDFMMRINFKRSSFDNCVYLKEEEDHTKTYFLLYVDDILIASVNKAGIEKLKRKL